MPLLQLAQADPDTVSQLSVQQLVAAAGDGELKDNSLCSTEFRQYLTEASVAGLSQYSSQCLAQALNKGGAILQDVVNELGRRLGYDVENGRYGGIVGGIGFDGLWKYGSGPALVVEVKTTDAYRLSLDTLANYQRKLVEKQLCHPESTVLIVVGRQDTGELEAQIRGSRHAWSVRLISVDSLIQLVSVHGDIGSPTIDARIRNLLRPAEYTRLDALVELVFSAAKEVDEPVPEEALPTHKLEADSPAIASAYEFTPAADLRAKRAHIVDDLSARLGVSLQKQSRATYRSADDAVRTVVSLSKRYARPTGRPYWYAFHPEWNDFLLGATRGLMVLGMMDRSEAYAIPVEKLRSWLEHLNTTKLSSGKAYWHLHILENADSNLSLIFPEARLFRW